MAEYSYKDVIIDPDDPRVEIGAEYYGAIVSNDALRFARDSKKLGKLLDIDYDPSSEYPFHIKTETADCWISCLIRKKEPKKKYVPFDLSKEEDRARLRGAWIRRKDYPGDEYQIVGISITNNLIFFDDSASLVSDVLLERCEFVDGSPCGRLVEE